MLERISDWFKHLQVRMITGIPNDLEIYKTIPLNRKNFFFPPRNKNNVKERTELFLTWYAKDSFFDCYHKQGSGLLDKPWKSVLISPHQTNGVLKLIFVDMRTLQHKVFNLPDKISWRKVCHIMFDEEYRPAKLFTRYLHPFNTRDFKFFAQSSGYVMCGWNSHKFLQKQIEYFNESYEILDKIKYILSHSSTVDHDLKLLQYFVSRNLEPKHEVKSCGSDQAEEESAKDSDFETTDEVEYTIFNEDKYDPSAKTTTDGAIKNKKINQPIAKYGKFYPNNRKHMISKNGYINRNDPHTLSSGEPVLTKSLSSSTIIPMMNHFSKNKPLKKERKNFFISEHRNSTKVNRTERKTGFAKWGCVLLDTTEKENMFYFIFMDADSCYPQVMENESCDGASCIDSCNRLLERHPDIKELHVPGREPFDSEELKSYLQMQGIDLYFDSPLLNYLNKPLLAFSAVKRIISRSCTFEQRSQALSEFVKKKIIIRNMCRRSCFSITTGAHSWEGGRVLAVEMANDDGNYLLFIDFENVSVEAYPKNPKGRFIFAQEIIVILVEAFNDFGIPSELHTIGGTLFQSPEFSRLMEYCRIKHCGDCWHVERGTSHFETFEKIKSCFAGGSSVQRGLHIWESLRKRLEINKRNDPKKTKMNNTLNKQIKLSNLRVKNKHYEDPMNSHDALTFVVGQALRQMNNEKRNEAKKSDLITLNKKKPLLKINQSKNLKAPVKREKHSGQIDEAKYQKMLNKLLKKKEVRAKGVERMKSKLIKRKITSNEKIKKKNSKSISKYKKNHSSKLWGLKLN